MKDWPIKIGRGGRCGGGGGLGKEGSLALQTTSVLTWVPLFGTPTLTALDWNSYTRQEPAPTFLPPHFPLSGRHTPRGIQNALTPNQWEYDGKKAKKKRERQSGRERGKSP